MNAIRRASACALPFLLVAVPASRAAAPAVRADASSSWADVDGDGRMELLVLGEGGELALLRLGEPGGFVDATERAGLADVRGARLLSVHDADGDGRPDVLVSGPEGTRLLRNAEDGTFRDRTAASGLAIEGEVLAARWLDPDGDGRADLHVVTAVSSVLFRGGPGGSFERLELTPGATPTARERHAGPAPSIQVAPASGFCAGSLRDAADPSACLQASSLPELGKLFPINRRLYVDTLGRVGLGTTTPLSKMHVVTTAPSHCIVYLQSSGPTYGESGIRFRTGQTTLSGWDLYMDDATLDELGDPDRLGFYHASAGVVMALDVVGGAGRVGINKRDPSVALDVDGDVCTSGMYLTCSDARLKTDVADLEGALDAVLALRGVRFRWAGGAPDDGPEIGFLAQEVAEVVPEAVARAADGRWSVDYARLTPVLVEALQAQEERLDELAAANAELRRTNDEILGRLERLESLVAQGR